MIIHLISVAYAFLGKPEAAISVMMQREEAETLYMAPSLRLRALQSYTNILELTQGMAAYGQMEDKEKVEALMPIYQEYAKLLRSVNGYGLCNSEFYPDGAPGCWEYADLQNLVGPNFE